MNMQIRRTGRAADSLDAFCHRGIGEKLWLASSQTDGAEQTDGGGGGGWRKNRWRDRTCRAADRETGKRGSPDRQALWVAGQAVGIGDVGTVSASGTEGERD